MLGQLIQEWHVDQLCQWHHSSATERRAGWLPTVEGPQWEADRELTLDLRDVISERGVRSETDRRTQAEALRARPRRRSPARALTQVDGKPGWPPACTASPAFRRPERQAHTSLPTKINTGEYYGHKTRIGFYEKWSNQKTRKCLGI